MNTPDTIIPGDVMVNGNAEGEIFLLDEPLSFSGGLDNTTGRITDRWHPQYDLNVAGKILSMASGRGSSSGSAVLAEALRRGTGPRALILSERDGIVTAGAIVANNLYGMKVPVLLINEAQRSLMPTGTRVQIDSDGQLHLISPPLTEQQSCV